MPLTTDPNHPDLNKAGANGQDKVYLVLSEEERAKGFVRPVRHAYIHKGLQPKSPLRDLTEEEHARYDQCGYVKFEPYPDYPENSAVTGRFWTQQALDKKACNTLTTMGQALSETYARQPSFYNETFCCHCNAHFRVEEFVWAADDTVVGS